MSGGGGSHQIEHVTGGHVPWLLTVPSLARSVTADPQYHDAARHAIHPHRHEPLSSLAIPRE
jgi:hypothetical protein